MMKLGIYENHIWELWGEELYERRSVQLWTQLLRLRKESLEKIQALTDFHIFVKFCLLLCFKGNIWAKFIR